MSKVGDSITALNSRWSFGGDVSETFDSHVSKSVPFYREGHDLDEEDINAYITTCKSWKSRMKQNYWHYS